MSNKDLTTLKAPAYLLPIHVKMSGYGLPKTLELTLNNILQDSQLASNEIAGNGPRTTIFLRFDACMEDTSLSPQHQSTPKSYRRKSSSQSNKDVERHVKLLREEMDHQNNSSSKRNVTSAMNLKSKDLSIFRTTRAIKTQVFWISTLIAVATRLTHVSKEHRKAASELAQLQMKS